MKRGWKEGNSYRKGVEIEKMYILTKILLVPPKIQLIFFVSYQWYRLLDYEGATNFPISIVVRSITKKKKQRSSDKCTRSNIVNKVQYWYRILGAQILFSPSVYVINVCVCVG